MTVSLQHAPLILPAIAITSPRAPSRVATPPLPDRITCASCDGSFPHEQTVAGGDDRVCRICGVYQEEAPVIRRGVVRDLLVGACLATSALATSLSLGSVAVFVQLGWLVQPEALGVAVLALTVMAMVAGGAAVAMWRDRRQLQVQTSWILPGWVLRVHQGTSAALLGSGAVAALVATITVGVLAAQAWVG